MRPRGSRIRTAAKRRYKRPRSGALALALVVTLLAPALPGLALVRTTIAIDGAFDDWARVFEDPANCVYDASGDSSSANTDLTVLAATYDGTYLYHYIRRAATGGGAAAPTYTVYLDLDGDGRMESTDMAVVYKLTGGNAFSSGTLYRYVPADATNGDPMPGDAGKPAGALGTQVPAAIAGAGASGGVELETCIPWSALGVPSDTPVGMQFTSALGSATDSAGVIFMRRYGVSLDPDRASGASADTTVTYVHTLTNLGNTPATFDLSASSSKRWPVTITIAATGETVTSVTLTPGASLEIAVLLHVPANTPDGTRDTLTVTATHGQADGVSDTATDITSIGPVLIIPDQYGSMAPGQTIAYRNTVTNNTEETRTIALSASSDKGWPGEIRDADGASTVTSLTLAPHESSTVTVLVTVPSGATIGTVNVTTIAGQVVGSPNLKGKGYDTTTARAALSVSPVAASAPAGAGSTVAYRHTVQNSWPTTRTISLSAASSCGWTVQILASDGLTPISTLTLGPNGEAADVIVRVRVPAGTPAGTIDDTTLTCTAGPHTATAADRTTVSSLATYGVGGFGAPQNTFQLGDTVYARGMGLAAGTQVRFRWSDPSGTVVRTSNLINADSTGIAQDACVIPATEPIGTWTVTLLSSTGTVIASVPFYVGYRANISAMTVSGGDAVESTLTIATTFENEGAVPLADTAAQWVIWRDEDSDGTFGPGDGYLAPDGSWAVYGSGDGYTHETAGIAVGTGAATLVSWTAPTMNLPSAGEYRLSATWTASTGMTIATAATTFTAVPGAPWIELTLSENAIDFGTVVPGVVYEHPNLGVLVRANVTFDLVRTLSGPASALGLSTQLGSLFSQASGERTYTDAVRIDVPWDTDPGSYSAEVVYTVIAR
ncbi:NEW3 domain-containing protein [Coriobacteriia bacterium Es71-Z0120]|uniref:COG1470 family protein n=1 Tax=Parvivirga hydrogeniphila TaxID=2939460 RepID=UPI002260E379|nr:NEW3 domain-containing protein [Parvivirga hydrogeniphila]MCL4079490.1 NEW3 domain-containing protein [Parvivirga hydrogeniphila]